MCLDSRFWSAAKRVNYDPTNDWKEVKFIRANFNALDALSGQKGVYAFVARPEKSATVHHSYILYIGQATNIPQRFKKYFNYSRSTHPSDQLRRRMVVVWRDCLYFQYVLTPSFNASKLTDFEYDLIDTIAPPINDRFRSRILSSYHKALEF